MSTGHDRLIAALDVGSTKVCCFIAGVDDADGVHVLGIGHRVCRGIESGAVVDMDETERAIRAAVDQAERVAGETVDEVVLSVSAGQPRSLIVEMEVDIDGQGVDQADIERVLFEAQTQIDSGERQVLHAFPACFSIDGSFGIRNPIGMYGERLSVAIHVVTAGHSPVRNIESCVNRAHLDVSEFVVAPYAAGLASLADDEMRLGAACIDMGGGTTSVSVFAQNALVHCDVIGMGGDHITRDIARGLLTPVDHAERLKTLYGNAVETPADDRECIDVRQLGEQDIDQDSRIPRSMLTGIIQPRLEEILEHVQARLSEAGFGHSAAGRVVLCGGASQLPGMRELAERILGKQVRLGRPRRIMGLADATAGPAFANCGGLLLHAVQRPRELMRRPAARPVATGTFGRVGRWFRDHF